MCRPGTLTQRKSLLPVSLRLALAVVRPRGDLSGASAGSSMEQARRHVPFLFSASQPGWIVRSPHSPGLSFPISCPCTRLLTRVPSSAVGLPSEDTRAPPAGSDASPCAPRCLQRSISPSVHLPSFVHRGSDWATLSTATQRVRSYLSWAHSSFSHPTNVRAVPTVCRARPHLQRRSCEGDTVLPLAGHRGESNNHRRDV